ncbi:hypothetical protein NC653_018489 [Populus alba x Populus x berolinensis]|uniref:Uncharacterized protein n=1 Tax=Populus alba x Populus x berolinensis TaxID=444605 RepID=A0AAD6VVE5_9ROSI|nr:hypothetical protein NC653_018489 [Populus alba x Populus x berolinensis]
MDKILFVHYILETAFSCQGLLNQMKQDLNLETVHLNVYRSIVELVYMQTSYLSFSSKSVTIAGTAIAHRWVEVKRNSVWLPELTRPSAMLRPKMVKMDEELGAYSSQHLRLRRDAHRTLLGSYNQNSY